MLFWPLLIVGLGALAWYLGGEPGLHLLEDENQQARAIYLTILLVGLLAGGAGRMLMRGGARTLIHAGAWLGIFTLLVGSYTYRGEIGGAVDRVRGEVMPAMAITHATGEVELRRGWDGHYRADVLMDGVRMRLMVDTGASMVLIPYERVRALGINPEKLVYSIPVTTANGRSSVAPIRVKRIELGEIIVEDVDVAVAQPGRLKYGLLGMNFLDRLDETTFTKDRLVLRQGAISTNRFIKAPSVE